MASRHSTAIQYLHHFIFRIVANVWNECGMTDCNRTIEKAPEKALVTGKRQVHDFVSNSFERIGFGNELGECCFIYLSLSQFIEFWPGFFYFRCNVCVSSR
jgi:hypothetical protein